MCVCVCVCACERVCVCVRARELVCFVLVAYFACLIDNTDKCWEGNVCPEVISGKWCNGRKGSDCTYQNVVKYSV